MAHLHKAQLEAYGKQAPAILDKTALGLLGGDKGEAWHENAKPAIRKKWESFLAYAKSTLMKKIDIAEFKNDIDEALIIKKAFAFLLTIQPVDGSLTTPLAELLLKGYGNFATALIFQAHMNMKDDSDKSRKALQKSVLDIVAAADEADVMILTAPIFPRELSARISAIRKREF